VTTSEPASGRIDHDDFGRNPSKIMNVIDSNSLERDAGEKPASPFSHPALELHSAYTGLREAFDREGGLPLEARRKALLALSAHLKCNAEAYAVAISDDFGHRSRHESLLTEIALLLDAITYTLPRLKRWAAPARVTLGWPFWPAYGRILKEPRGVVGVIAPSNYPLQLALMPVISALAAGCRVLVKPSELTPRTAALMQEGVKAAIDPKIVNVICGDMSVASEMTHLPLDALLFTGSERVGHIVMSAASQHLTPVTLELGGKSPVVIDRSADLKLAAESIVAGKLLNAGQTCVAPDYVLYPRELQKEFIAQLRAAALKLYPDIRDYTSINSDKAVQRLQALEIGQDIIPLFREPVAPPYYRPALVVSPAIDSPIMEQEIFGPLLPLLPYDTQDDAIHVIKSIPTPLVLYWFGTHAERRDDILARTRSGSVSINETVLHAGVQALPFGGMGASGLGRYHGKAGFDTFTHERSIFHQARWSITKLLRPPFGQRAERILKLLLR
jgi:coniferyl-aldehyde dehydrogenase